MLPHLPSVEGLSKTVPATAAHRMYGSPKERKLGKAAVSTWLMHSRDAGNVGYSLPTSPGLSKNFDLAGLRLSTASPSLLRPLLNGAVNWQDDDKALYGSNHHIRASGYESEVDFSSPQAQKFTRPTRTADWGQPESDTRLGWPSRTSMSMPLAVGRLAAQTEGLDDLDGHMLFREFKKKVESARQSASEPGLRFEPTEGGLGGDGASATSSARGPAPALDTEGVVSKIEKKTEEQRGPRPFPDSLNERYEYFLEISGTTAWSRLNEFMPAKKMPFDIVEEEHVFSEMLQRAICMVEERIPGCGAVLRESFEWFVQVPIDKVMLARREQWRRPHRDAFNALESQVQDFSKNAENAQLAAVQAVENSQRAMFKAKEASERAAFAEKAQRQTDVALKTTQKSAAQRLEEATIAQERTNKQAADIIHVRKELEDRLRDLHKEQRLRKQADEKREELLARIEALEQENLNYVKQLKGTRAAKRAKKIAMRNKILLSEVNKYETMAKNLIGMVEKEKTRVKGGKEGEVPLRIKLDRALKESEAEDEKLTNDGGVPTLTNQASTLQKYVQPSSEFSKKVVSVTSDHEAAIGEIQRMVDGFNMADELPDSDSDGDIAEIEQLKKDNDFLLEKQFNYQQAIKVRDLELLQLRDALDVLKESLSVYEKIQRDLESKITTIREDANRKVWTMENELEHMRATMQEIKMREQDYKEQIRSLAKDVAARDKEITQFDMKTAQFKNKIESLTKENEAAQKKVSELTSKVDDMKIEMQQLKDENRAMHSKMKEFETKIHDLEVELAVERETVKKLHGEAIEYKRQIKLLEEHARQHAAEMLALKEASLKAAQEAKVREEKLQRETKELETKLVKQEREFKTKLDEANTAKQEAEDRYRTVKEVYEKVKVQYENVSKDITHWKEKAAEALGEIEGHKKAKEDAEKKLADAKEFVDKYDEFMKEMNRLKEVEAEFKRKALEFEEALNDFGGGAGGALGHDDEFSEFQEKAKKSSGAMIRRMMLLKKYIVTSKAGVLGPWVEADAPDEADPENESKLLLVSMLAKQGRKVRTDVSISSRMQDFKKLVAQHFMRAAGGPAKTIDGETAEKAMTRMGLRADFIKQSLDTVNEKTMLRMPDEILTGGVEKGSLAKVPGRRWLDKNAFADAVAMAQSLSTWSKIDREHKGTVTNADVTTYLQGIGYSNNDCEEYVHHADFEQKGCISKEMWVEAWSKHIGTTIEVEASFSATAVANVSAVGVSATKMFRNAGNAIVFTRARPQMGTQTSFAEATGREAGDSSAGGGSTGLQPSSLGRMLEKKDQEMTKAEGKYVDAVNQISHLLTILHLRTRHYQQEIKDLKQKLQVYDLNNKALRLTQGTDTRDLAYQDVHALHPSDSPRSLDSPRSPLPYSPTAELWDLEETLPPLFQAHSEVYMRRPELSVQVRLTRTKFADLVQDFAPHSGAIAPRSMTWLSKILHAILGSKMVSDAVDMSMNLPMASYAAFCADWMRNRFGVEALVRKSCLQLDASLRAHSQKSDFVQLLADLFDGEYGPAEQRVFLHAYSLVADLMDRQRVPLDTPEPHEISLSAAVDIVRRVLPYAWPLDAAGINNALLAPLATDSLLSSGEQNWDKVMIPDNKLYNVIINERRKVQEKFHGNMTIAFMRQDAINRHGVVSYEEMSRFMTTLVPWNDPHKIQATITNICPELLMPGAVIDIKNLLVLDQRVDFLGCNVNGFKINKDKDATKDFALTAV